MEVMLLFSMNNLLFLVKWEWSIKFHPYSAVEAHESTIVNKKIIFMGRNWISGLTSYFWSSLDLLYVLKTSKISPINLSPQKIFVLLLRWAKCQTKRNILQYKLCIWYISVWMCMPLLERHDEEKIGLSYLSWLAVNVMHDYNVSNILIWINPRLYHGVSFIT